MEEIRFLIIGAIQGVTEFLPVSSSGHLVLVPYLFDWDYQGLAIDVALHFGTVLAIIAFFWRDWWRILQNALVKSEKLNVKNESESKIDFHLSPFTFHYPRNLLWQILVASIPAAIVGFAISGYVESTFHSPLLLAFNLIFFGVLLWAADKLMAKNIKLSAIGYKQSFLIGLAQSIALIPGVSRSGITMTAGRSLGLPRESAARFSFLLGTPAMIGAFLFQAKDLQISTLGTPFWVGTVSATVFGFIAIKYLLEYLKKGSFAVFLWYRVILAIIVIAAVTMR